jgi:hypothetical protein
LTKEALASHEKVPLHIHTRNFPSVAISQALPLKLVQVYRRFLSALGPRHADTADIMYNIGLLHKDLLDFGAADQHLRAALSIYTKVEALA